MLAIRMRRMGAKNRPFFRVVVTDSRLPWDSRFVEALGLYDPKANPERLDINNDRLAHWLKVGARPSDTVRTLVDRLAKRASEVSEPVGSEVKSGKTNAVVLEQEPAKTLVKMEGDSPEETSKE